MTEERLVDNLIRNYDKASNNKVYVEGIINENVELELDDDVGFYFDFDFYFQSHWYCDILIYHTMKLNTQLHCC